MSNKKVLSQATRGLNKAKAPSKPRDIIYDPMGYWNPNNQGQPVRIRGNGKGTNITMGPNPETGTPIPYPVRAQPNVGQPQMMQPGQDYNFPEADYVDEYPQMKKGGLKKNKTSRNLMATNKLFAKHAFFKKPGKNVIFDPNSPNYQDGGFIIELDDDEIQAYKDGGYVVEDISIPTLNTMDKGGAAGCPPEHYYNGKSCVKIPAETKKAKVINDPDEYAFRKAAYDDSLHLYNTYKNLEPKKVGKLRSTKNTWHDPYKTYTATKIFTPAEQKEWASNHGGRSQAFLDYASKLSDAEMEKGNFDFDWPSVKNDPIGYKANVGIYKLLNRNTGKDTKNSEIAFRFKKPVQPVVLGQKSNPKPKSTNLKPKTTNAKTVAKVENQYPTGYDQPIVTPVPPGKTQVGTQEIQNLDPKTGRVKTIIEPVYEDNPIPEKLPLLSPQLIDTSRAELQGEYIENNAPEYQMPGYDVERAGIVMRHGNRPTLTTVRRPGMVSKALQKFTGYNPEYSEGYTDEEGNYVSGEFENAQAENRRVNFQGAGSLQDLKAQKEYNKAYDEYNAKQQFAKAMAAGYALKKDGGEPNSMETELTDAEIEQLRKQGYVIELI